MSSTRASILSCTISRHETQTGTWTQVRTQTPRIREQAVSRMMAVVRETEPRIDQAFPREPAARREATETGCQGITPGAEAVHRRAALIVQEAAATTIRQDAAAAAVRQDAITAVAGRGAVTGCQETATAVSEKMTHGRGAAATMQEAAQARQGTAAAARRGATARIRRGATAAAR